MGAMFDKYNDTQKAFKCNSYIFTVMVSVARDRALSANGSSIPLSTNLGCFFFLLIICFSFL